MSFKALRNWSKGLKWQRAETLEVLRVRQAALEAREAKSIEKETSLLVMEQDTKAHKDQVEKDAQLLRQQLHGARAELEDQRRYVEEKRNEAEAMATIVEEREARLKLKEQELAERKVTDPEIGYYTRGNQEKHREYHIVVEGSAEYKYHAQMSGTRLSSIKDLVSFPSILLRGEIESTILRVSNDVLE